MYIYDNISLNSSWNEKVSDKSCREYQNTLHAQLHFPENRAVYDVEKYS
jgi:hypothetical protein